MQYTNVMQLRKYRFSIENVLVLIFQILPTEDAHCNLGETLPTKSVTQSKPEVVIECKTDADRGIPRRR